MNFRGPRSGANSTRVEPVLMPTFAEPARRVDDRMPAFEADVARLRAAAIRLDHGRARDDQKAAVGTLGSRALPLALAAGAGLVGWGQLTPGDARAKRRGARIHLYP